jgi:hypothetical protein
VPRIDVAVPTSNLEALVDADLDTLAAALYVRTRASRCAGVLSGLRQEFYRCLPARADALFELAEAVLCADGPVRSPMQTG